MNDMSGVIGVINATWFVEMLSIGITPEFVKKDGIWYLDLKSGAKSHFYLRHVGPDCNYFIMNTRYDGDSGVYLDDLDDVARVIKADCMCGRDYLSPFWGDYIKQLGAN